MSTCANGAILPYYIDIDCVAIWEWDLQCHIARFPVFVVDKKYSL